MGLFAFLYQRSRARLVLAVTAGIVSGLSSAVFVAIVNQVLRDPQVTPGIVAAFVGVCLLAVGARFVSQIVTFRIAQGEMESLRRHLVDSVLAAPLRTVEKLGTSRLLSTLTDDVVIIGDALPSLPLITASIAFVVGCLAYIAVLSWEVALGALLAALIGAAVYQAFATTGLRALTRAREHQDELFENLHAVTDGTKELKLNKVRRDAFLTTRLAPSLAAQRREGVLGLSIFEGAVGGGQVVLFSFIGLVIFVAPSLLDIAQGTLASSVLTILFAVTNVQGIVSWIPLLGRASVALASIEDQERLLRETTEPLARTVDAAAFGAWSGIELAGVSHIYPGPRGEQFVLGPVDLRIERGKITFIVGGNGSGKSTLAKVLTGLYVPESGLVRVGDATVTDANRENYRQQFSAIFSDPYLLPSLLLGDGEEIQHKLARLRLDHKVTIDDGEFSTTALSTGQRKRLALLAAYAEDRPVYLFDEWAADQDPEFKQVFYEELLPELSARGKCVVVISHDDRYFHVADCVVQLESGQLTTVAVAS